MSKVSESMAPLAPRYIAHWRLSMKSWTWQKWIGKLLPFVLAVAAAVWQLIDGQPTWWPTVAAALTGVVQWVVALFPAKA